MWQDPIVKETRKRRNEYAEQFKHDPDLIFEDIRNRQEKTNRKRITFPARRPKLKQNIA